MRIRKKVMCKRRMCYIMTFLLCMTLMPKSMTVSAKETDTEAETAATVQLAKTEGTVEVSNASGHDVTMIKNMRLLDGYRISTQKKSYAWTQLDKAKLLKVDSVSEIEVRKKGKVLEVFLNSGRMSFNITEPLEEDETLNICTSSMVGGVRGTCGWVQIKDKLCTRVYVLEGKLECNVADPVTGQSKDIYIEGGEYADFYVYDKDKTGDKCDIIQESFQKEEIPGFILEQLLGDEKRCQEIYDDSKIDLRNVTEEEVKEQLQKEEEEMQKWLLEIEKAVDEQEGNISKEPVFDGKNPQPAAVPRAPVSADTPDITPTAEVKKPKAPNTPVNSPDEPDTTNPTQTPNPQPTNPANNPRPTDPQPTDPVNDPKPTDPPNNPEPTDPVNDPEPTDPVNDPQPTDPVNDPEPTDSPNNPQPTDPVNDPVTD